MIKTSKPHVADYDIRDFSFVEIRIFDGIEKAVTSSLSIGRVFSRSHEAIIDDIRSLDLGSDFFADNFFVSKYLSSIGQAKPLYYMTQNGFAVLTSRYNSPQSTKYKESFFMQYQEAERIILSRKTGTMPFYPVAAGPTGDNGLVKVMTEIKDILSEYRDIAGELVAELRQQKVNDGSVFFPVPTVPASIEDRIKFRNDGRILPKPTAAASCKPNSKDEYGIRDVANYIGCKQSDVSNWLRVNGYLVLDKNGRPAPSEKGRIEAIFSPKANCARIKFSQYGLGELAWRMREDGIGKAV